MYPKSESALSGHRTFIGSAKICLYSLIIVICIFAILRFINLQADFPRGITWAGVLYSDEGWYSNAAINHHINDKWYVEGGFNPIVNLPLGQVVQAINFKLNGMSLASARLIPAVSLVVIGICIFFWLRESIGIFASLLSTLLLYINYIAFAYSRLAILELPMLCLTFLSLILAYHDNQHRFVLVSLASFIMGLAILMKSTAVFALPVFAYILYTKGKPLKRRYVLPIIAVASTLGMVMLYNAIMYKMYPSDVSYFNQINFYDRLSLCPLDVMKNGLKSVIQAQCLAPIFYPLTLMLCFFLFCYFGDFRTNTTVRTSILWIVMYFGLLATTSYHPPRYFLPLIIPICILFGVSFSVIYSHIRNWWAPSIITAFAICGILLNCYKISVYMLKPQYSFINMAHQVQNLISEHTPLQNDVLLMGNLANSISLVTGTRSINATIGPGDMMWRAGKYGPDYFVSLGKEPDTISKFNQTYTVELIGTFDAYGNYYDNKKIRLFRLLEKAH